MMTEKSKTPPTNPLPNPAIEGRHQIPIKPIIHQAVKVQLKMRLGFWEAPNQNGIYRGF